MESEKRKIDRRVIRTKKAIRNTFADLISKKDLNDITIQEITDGADISRKTFYYYYDGIWGLVDEIQYEIADKIAEVIGKVDLKFSEEAYSKIIEEFKNNFQYNNKLYSSIINASKNPIVSERIIDTFKKRFKEQYEKYFKSTSEVQNIALDFVLSGSFYVFRNWFISENPGDLDELLKVTLTATRFGLKGLIDNNMVFKKE